MRRARRAHGPESRHNRSVSTPEYPRQVRWRLGAGSRRGGLAICVGGAEVGHDAPVGDLGLTEGTPVLVVADGGPVVGDQLVDGGVVGAGGDQGLGRRSADRVPPRVAARRRRLGRPADVLRPARLPRRRPRPAPRPLDAGLGRARHGHRRRRRRRRRRPARPARRRPHRPFDRRRPGWPRRCSSAR